MPKHRVRSKYADRYEPIAESDVPMKILWNRGAGGRKNGFAYYFSLGKNYRKVVDMTTGAATYAKLKDGAEPPKRAGTRGGTQPTPGALPSDDAPKGPQVRYRIGAQCWFIDNDARWYLCTVVNRTQKPASKITIRPVTGRDALRECDWPYGGELEFGAHSPLFARLQPLKARQP